MKKFFAFFWSISLVLALISCSELSSGESSSTSLSITLPSPVARSVWYDDVDSFSIEVKSSGQTTGTAPAYNQTKEGKSGETVTFSDIPEGQYTVTVLAKNSNNKTIGKGSENATVKSGEVTRVVIKVKKEAEPENPGGQTGGGTGGISPVIELTSAVTFNGEDFDSIAEAISKAKATTGISSTKTITLNEDIEENFLTTDIQGGETASYDMPWYILDDLILDLNGHTLKWKEFTPEMKDENNPIENPLFHVGEDYTLVIKNGTITSESGVEHSNILIGTTGGTVVLEDVTIENVSAPYILNIINYSPENSHEDKKGVLFCDNVTIKNCDGLAITSTVNGSSTTSLGVPVYVNSSEIYAQKMTIENTTGKNGLCGLLIQNSSGAFVGSSISLSEDLGVTKQNGSAIAIIGGSLYISSTTIYANTNHYGVPVKVVDGGSINLADGFEFTKFDIDKFESEKLLDNGNIYITPQFLGFEQTASIIAAGESVTESDSTKTALILGSSSSNTGALYISGNSSIYGVVDLFLESSIGVTGAITSSEPTKVKFESIESYASVTDGDYPIFWAAGDENATDNKDHSPAVPRKFTVYGDSAYTIQDSGRTIKYASGEADGNKIYAPVLSN